MSELAVKIPDQLYFKIGDVAKLFKVEPHVLRFWEKEFPEIRPSKTKSKHRLYRRTDVDIIASIYTLLYQQKYTIKGAKKRIRELLREKGLAEFLRSEPLFDAVPEPQEQNPQKDEALRQITKEMEAWLLELDL